MTIPGIYILVDYTNLKPEASFEELSQLAKEAQKNGFNSICIRSNWIKDFAKIYPCSATIAFPEKIYWCNSDDDKKSIIKEIGNKSLEEKLAEAKLALDNGAVELDPVINLNDISKHDFKNLRAELQAYVTLLEDWIATSPLAPRNDRQFIWLKPIFSCELLDNHNIEFSIDIFSQVVTETDSNKIKFAYKNSTGFIKSETNYPLKTTSVELISFITDQLDEYDQDAKIHIKAAGGIKNREQAEAIIQAARGRLSHIGTSALL